jgi:hypothetical protein
MNKPNLYTVQLKLKRHKLSMLQLESEDAIQLGGVMNLTLRIIISIVLPVFIGLSLIIIGYFFKIGLLEVLGFLILLYASYEMTVIKSKKANNKNIKIIRNGELELNSNSNITLFKKEEIKEFNIDIQLMSKETYEGKLFFKDLNDKEHVILSINDQEKRLLKDDLTYLKNFIESKINTVPNL